MPEPMPPAGQIRLRVDGDRITLHASEAPRRALLEMLAHELGFALIATQLDNEAVTVRADAQRLPAILPGLLADRPYRLDYQLDPVAGRHTIARLEVGSPGDAGFDPTQAEGNAGDAALVVVRPDARPARDEDAARVDWKELLLRLDDSDAEERMEALADIDSEGEGLALITDRLARDPDPRVRAAAAEQLEFADNLAAVDALVLALGDPDRNVVLAAIDALELTEDATVVEDLALLLEHPDPEIREAAQEAIPFIADDAD